MIDDLLGIQNIGVVSLLDFLLGIFELIILTSFFIKMDLILQHIY